MILSMSTIPTTLHEWIKKAKTFHAQKMCIAAIRGRKENPSLGILPLVTQMPWMLMPSP